MDELSLHPTVKPVQMIADAIKDVSARGGIVLDLFGGSGSVIGTLIGALLIGLINNGLILAGLDASQQQVIRGAIIILAVALAKKK